MVVFLAIAIIIILLLLIVSENRFKKAIQERDELLEENIKLIEKLRLWNGK